MLLFVSAHEMRVIVCVHASLSTSFSAHTGCTGVLDVSVVLMLLLLMAGDVELNPGPGKCEYLHFAGSCVHVVHTATHFVHSEDTRDTWDFTIG